jgi:hypothetical protein
MRKNRLGLTQKVHRVFVIPALILAILQMPDAILAVNKFVLIALFCCANCRGGALPLPPEIGTISGFPKGK